MDVINKAQGSIKLELYRVDTVVVTKEANSVSNSSPYTDHTLGYLPFLMVTAEYDNKTVMLHHYELNTLDPPRIGLLLRFLSTDDFFWFTIWCPSNGQYYTPQFNVTFKVYSFKELTAPQVLT